MNAEAVDSNRCAVTPVEFITCDIDQVLAEIENDPAGGDCRPRITLITDKPRRI